jgi:hypothetical protein
MFGKNSMFGTRKPRAFKHVPIYWDPEKEDRIKQEKWRNSIKGEEANLRFRQEFQKEQKKRMYNTRMLLVVLILLVLFIFFW